MDYHVVAQGYGGLGYQLTRADKDKIDQILSEAREKSRETGKSVLINALIGKTGFRDGSISVWFRSKYFWVDRLKRPQQLSGLFFIKLIKWTVSHGYVCWWIIYFCIAVISTLCARFILIGKMEAINQLRGKNS